VAFLKLSATILPRLEREPR